MTISVVSMPLHQSRVRSPTETRYWDASKTAQMLVRSPPPERWEDRSFACPRVPLGLVSIAAVVRESGQAVEFLDLWSLFHGTAVNDGFLERRLAGSTADVFLFAPTPDTHDLASEIAAKIRSQRSGAVTIVGSGLASVAPEGCLDWFDIVVLNDGVRPFRALAQCSFEREQWRNIPGIAFRDGDRTIINRPEHGQTHLPIPAYDLLPEAYRQSYYARTFTQHGCAGACGFCPRGPLLGIPWGLRTRDYVERNVRSLTAAVDCSMLYVTNGDFFWQHGHAIAVCDILGSVGIPWRAQARVDTVVPDVLLRMRASQGIQLDFGVESFDEAVLKGIGKQTARSDIYRAINWTHAAGIQVHINLMVGLPGETRESARNTIDRAVNLIESGKLTSVDYFVTVPYPDSHFYMHPERYGLSIAEARWSNFKKDGAPLCGSGCFPREEIKEAWLEGMERLADALLAVAR